MPTIYIKFRLFWIRWRENAPCIHLYLSLTCDMGLERCPDYSGTLSCAVKEHSSDSAGQAACPSRSEIFLNATHRTLSSSCCLTVAFVWRLFHGDPSKAWRLAMPVKSMWGSRQQGPPKLWGNGLGSPLPPGAWAPTPRTHRQGTPDFSAAFITFILFSI